MEPTRTSRRRSTRGHLALLVALCRRGAVGRPDARCLAFLEQPAEREALVHLAAAHGVLGLVGATLVRGDLPMEFPVRSDEGFGWIDRQLRRRAAVFVLGRDHALSRLRDAGVRVVVLKGAALLGTVYRDPAERDLADLDLLVERSDLRAAVLALRAEGYATPPAFPELRVYLRHHFHVPLFKQGAHCVELHWAMVPPGSPFNLDPKAVFDEAVEDGNSGDGRFLVPRAEHAVLHLVLQNLQEDFSRLGRLVDIDRIVARTPDLDWDRLVSEARSGGLGPATWLTLEWTRRLLGCGVPRRHLDALRPDGLTRFHLAVVRPAPSQGARQHDPGFSSARLLLFWLLDGWGKRFALLRALPRPDPLDPLAGKPTPGPLRRWLRPLKLASLQIVTYVAAPSGAARRAPGAQTRF